LGPWDWAIVASVIVIIVVAALYFLNRWAGKRMAQQNEMVEKHKQTATIYISTKRKTKSQMQICPRPCKARSPAWARS
jgi:uncharacterized membrane protein YhiD involved in acid resistance